MNKDFWLEVLRIAVPLVVGYITIWPKLREITQGRRARAAKQESDKSEYIWQQSKALHAQLHQELGRTQEARDAALRRCERMEEEVFQVRSQALDDRNRVDLLQQEIAAVNKRLQTQELEVANLRAANARLLSLYQALESGRGQTERELRELRSEIGKLLAQSRPEVQFGIDDRQRQKV